MGSWAGTATAKQAQILIPAVLALALAIPSFAQSSKSTSGPVKRVVLVSIADRKLAVHHGPGVKQNQHADRDA